LRRNTIFKKLISSLPKPVKILDVGGTEEFWKKVGFYNDISVEITLVNLHKIDTRSENISSFIGDARSLMQCRDKEFDVVFSNSVIEHVGTFLDQKKMADELIRVGKRLFLQTPNFYFPFEPHFLLPFFQFFPLKVKVFLIQHFSLGWMGQHENVADAISVANSIRLLKKRELELLFLDSTIIEEKFIGITYSFIVYKGFDT